MTEYSSGPVSQWIWEEKYRYRTDASAQEAAIEDSWRRIATALAECERPEAAEAWRDRFYELLSDFKFLPGGRIQAGAGTQRHVTLFNCFVMGNIEDSIGGIFEGLKESALTLQQGGGIGLDFSTLRPHGMAARRVGTAASGPLSFMRIWDSMCATIHSTGARRGAMMAVLRCDHPDIEAFIDAKRELRSLSHFNLSVLVSDAFMDAVSRDAEWALVFPLSEGEMARADDVERIWSGSEMRRPCRVFKKVNARALWRRLVRAAYDCAEPGVIFIDRVNRLNNLWYCERISAANPCGEIPLPAYGACNLGSLNLTRYVRSPFTVDAMFDMDGIEVAAAIATRMLDNVYDISHFPLEKQGETARATRRLGLGITGLADALIMLGIPYDSPAALDLSGRLMARIAHAAYRASIGLAREKGAFPVFDVEKYLQGEFVSALPGDIRQGIRRFGIRNSHLTAIAPAGTISLLAGNVSSGLEPVYAWRYRRAVRTANGSNRIFDLQDFAYERFRKLYGEHAPLPPAFVSATEIAPVDHLGMQAALQVFVDNAISKTINIPENLAFDDFSELYRLASQLGLKGCTVFRPNPVRGQILDAGEDGILQSHCCSAGREAD